MKALTHICMDQLNDVAGVSDVLRDEAEITCERDF